MVLHAHIAGAFRASLTVVLLPLLFASTVMAEPAYARVSDHRVSVPFVIVVEEETYRTMLTELSDVTIALNEKKVLEQLVRRFEQYGMVFEEAERAEVAKRVYAEVVESKMQKRVEAFNEGINEKIYEDDVGVGLLAFTGLAKGMARMSDSVAEAKLDGRYHYDEGSFEDGQWKWVGEGGISGRTGHNRRFSVAIDETLEIDLTRFNLREAKRNNTSVELRFLCSGEVQLEQKYSYDYINDAVTTNEPQTIRRFRPRVDITATTTISAESVFTVTGKKRDRIKKRIVHPATMEVKFAAEELPPVQD